MVLSRCPVCSSNNIINKLEVKDFLVSGEYFTIMECKSCSLRFTNPRPNDEKLSAYYQSDDYISHTNEGNNLINSLYKTARYFTLRSKRKLVEKGTSEKNILDLGCGTGHFIAHCAHKGWQAAGVEPEDKARAIAAQNKNVQVYSNLAEIVDQSFDSITLWHVLEHLPDLNNQLQHINSLLKSNGALFIAVPNYQAREEKVFKEYWAAYDVPRHLYHFTRKSIAVLAKNNGLKIEKVYPMWLDSFYISLLSNKNKYGKNKMVKSFITGLISNTYAINSRNYSSLIYKLSKTS